MSTLPVSPPSKTGEATRLRDLTPRQWRGGIAAWLGWLFDGLDSYLYVLVAAVFVKELIPGASKAEIGAKGAWIQATFLVGWALGGAVFGRVGDRFGRSRTLSYTILTYAVFTGLSSVATNWQSLQIFRFLAALGIGGEWAAGASLVAETWPRRWHLWVSAVLQTAYQVGILLSTLALALLAGHPRLVFLVGIVPALLTFWIRRAIPEPEEWHQARAVAQDSAAAQRRVESSLADLFRGDMRRTTVLTLLVCSVALVTVWAFVYFFPQHLRRLPEVARLDPAKADHLIALASALVMVVGIGSNFFANGIARFLGYRLAVGMLFAGGLISLLWVFSVPRGLTETIVYGSVASFFVQGVFGLFPMYVPPLFPTLLRTTGAGFCYNFGRVMAAIGTLLLAPQAAQMDYRMAMVYVALVYIPGLILAFLIPEPSPAASAEFSL